MKVCTLASGSRGNSTFVESGSTRLLIDAGLPSAVLVRRLLDLQVLPVSIAGIFLTHEHADHTRGVRKLVERYNIPVYANPATAEIVSKTRRGDRKSLPSGAPFRAEIVPWHIVPTGDAVTLGGLKIRSFPVPHDGAEPVGYTVQSRARKIAVVTDIGSVTTLVKERIRSADLLIIEANHDERKLLQGPYPWAIKERIRGRMGHLSNAAAARIIRQVVENSPRPKNRRMHIVLAHLSEENNDPDLARDTVVRALNGAVMPGANDSTEASDWEITVAPSRRRGPLIEV